MHDQEFNLDRVEALGGGIHLSELRFRPEHLREAVDRVLTDPTFRQGAERQGQVLLDYHGPTRAADAVEAYLAGSAGEGGSAGSSRVSIGK